MFQIFEITGQQILSRPNPIVASIATILHVSPPSMLLTVVPVGPVDGAMSNMKDVILRNQKKLDIGSWTLNIGKYRLSYSDYGLFSMLHLF